MKAIEEICRVGSEPRAYRFQRSAAAFFAISDFRLRLSFFALAAPPSLPSCCAGLGAAVFSWSSGSSPTLIQRRGRRRPQRRRDASRPLVPFSASTLLLLGAKHSIWSIRIEFNHSRVDQVREEAMNMIVRMLVILLTIAAAGFRRERRTPVLSSELGALVSETTKSWKRKSLPTDGRNREPAMGFVTYTADGRMNLMIADPARKKPAQTFATDAEAAGLYRTMNAYAGTYRVEGDQIKIHVEIALQQPLVGADLTRSFKLDGDRLTTITPPFASAIRTNQTHITTIVWERVK